MDDDLYANLPQSKRQKVVETQRDEKKKETDIKPAAKLQQTLEQSLAKIVACMVRTSSIDLKTKTHSLKMKASKAKKAGELFVRLIENQLSSSNVSHFEAALNDELFSEKSESLRHTKPYSEAFSTVMEAVIAKRDLFHDQDRVDNWIFDTVTHHQLITDDTYEFSKAAKAVHEFVLREGTLDDPLRRKFVMICLKTLFARHTTAWAKVSVEGIFRSIAANRERFSVEERKQVDEWTTLIQNRRVQPEKIRTEATERRRNIVMMDKNDPKTGVKVGVHNHPLFNKS